MAQKTTVHSDQLGLYVRAGGYICRPFYGTKFKAGDKVLSHHFGGSTNTGVTSQGKPETHNFTKNGKWEIWCTTGAASTNKSFEETVQITKWYEDHQKSMVPIYKPLNANFEP